MKSLLVVFIGFFAVLGRAEIHLFANSGDEVSSFVAGKKITIQINDLAPQSEFAVDVRCRIFHPNSMQLFLRSDEKGTLEFSSYDFWRLKKEETESPEEAFSQNGCQISVGEQTRWASFLFQAPDVRFDELKDSEWAGVWYLPPKPRASKVIVTFSGSEGGHNFFYSSQLANHGFISLSMAYFGSEGVTEDLELISLNKFQAVLDAIKDRFPQHEIYLMAPSRGSELALLLGSRYPAVNGVIAMVPTVFAWGANTDRDVSAWTWNEEMIRYLRVVGGLEPFVGADGKEALANRPAFERGLQQTPVEQKNLARIPLDKISGRMLFIGGDDDQLWPSCEFTEMARQQLIHSPYKNEFLCFKGAGHDILIPGWPKQERSLLHPHMGVRVALGGTAEQTAFAEQQAWKAIFDFLR